MGKKLQELFAPKDYTYTGKIDFDDLESFNKFQKQMECMFSTGESQNIKMNYALKMNQNSAGKSYEVINEENGTELSMFLSREEIKVPIKLDDIDDHIILYRTVSDKFVKNCTAENAIVKFEFVWEKYTNKTQFKCKMQEDKAKNIEEIVYQYRKAIELFKILFIKVPDQVNTIIEYLENSIIYFDMIKSVAEILKIEVKTSDLKELSDIKMETLYLLLVKKVKIKGEFNIDSVEEMEESTPEIGQNLILHSTSKNDIRILGHKIILYQVTCGFYFTISDVIVRDDGSKKVMFKPVEGLNSIVSYSAFVDEQEANEEINKLKEKIKEYKDNVNGEGGWYDYRDAKGADFLISQLYNHVKSNM